MSTIKQGKRMFFNLKNVTHVNFLWTEEFRTDLGLRVLNKINALETTPCSLSTTHFLEAKNFMCSGKVYIILRSSQWTSLTCQPQW